MRLDIKKLHKNYLNKINHKEGHTTDIIITLMQSCELVLGNYLFIISENSKFRDYIKDEIVKFLLQFTDSHISIYNNQYIGFSNGSKIYFRYVEGVEFENIYWDFCDSDKWKSYILVKEQTTKYFDSIEHENKIYHEILKKIHSDYSNKFIKTSQRKYHFLD